MIRGTDSIMNWGTGIIIGSLLVGVSLVFGPIIYSTVHNTSICMQALLAGIVTMPVGMLTGGALIIRAGAILDLRDSLIRKVKHEHNASGSL